MVEVSLVSKAPEVSRNSHYASWSPLRGKKVFSHHRAHLHTTLMHYRMGVRPYLFRRQTFDTWCFNQSILLYILDAVLN